MSKRKAVEEITLDSDDNDDDENAEHTENVTGADSQGHFTASATVSVKSGQPLNLAALLNTIVLSEEQSVASLGPEKLTSHDILNKGNSSLKRMAVTKNRGRTTAKGGDCKVKRNIRTSEGMQVGVLLRNSSSLFITYDKEFDLCCESFDPNAPPFEAQQFCSKFRCTFGKCRTLLSNNVSYIFHLWAHVVSSPSDVSGENALRSMRLCPQCLHVFPTPYRLLSHYNNVHVGRATSIVCRICEITADMSKHLHSSTDMPYQCRKCRYRTSYRMNGIRHFVRFHANTPTLLCPFCFIVFKVPAAKERSSICDKGFLSHMQRHQISKLNSCDRCALKFIKQSELNNHVRDHAKVNPKWVVKRMKIHPRLKGRKLWPEKVINRCLECNEVVDDLREHTRWSHMCPNCEYRTRCYTSWQHHKSVRCTVSRTGLTRIRMMRSSLICEGCGRESCDEKPFLTHILECGSGKARIGCRRKNTEDDTPENWEASEASMFAVCEGSFEVNARYTHPRSKNESDSREQSPTSRSSSVSDTLGTAFEATKLMLMKVLEPNPNELVGLRNSFTL